MAVIRPSTKSEGVAVAELVSFSDERGAFRETFRAEWFPQVSRSQLQANRSDSQAHVMRGLHFIAGSLITGL